MSRLTFNVDFDEDAIRRKMEAAINDRATMYEIHMAFARKIDPWVPYLTGLMSRTVEIEPECIRYTTPYARRQYYGLDFNHTKDTHPLASAMWDKVAMETQLDSFKAEVKDILKRRIHG